MLFTTKIEQATQSPKHKFGNERLRGVLLDIAKDRAVATDGHIMAIVPIEHELAHQPDINDSVIIPAEAVKQSHKRNHSITIDDNKAKVSNSSSTSEYSLIDGTFPDYEAVIAPRTDRYICLNAELLAKLQIALTDIGSDKPGIKLYIHADNHSAMRVEPIQGEAFGVIMPMSDR